MWRMSDPGAAEALAALLDERARTHRGDRPNAVYVVAVDGDRLHGGEHLGPSRLRHRGDALTFELEPDAPA